MPIGPYRDFDSCVADQVKGGKSRASAQRICGAMERDMTKMTILEKQAERRYTLGVVYEPDVTDTQGDFAKAEDIEEAAWDFMARLQLLAKASAELLKAFHEVEELPDGVSIDVTDLEVVIKASGLDDEHLQVGEQEELGVIVESYLAPCAMVVEGQPVKKGAWLLGVRWSPEMFDKIKKGERTGLSMYGRADQV